MNEILTSCISNSFYVISGIQILIYLVVFGRLVFFNKEKENAAYTKNEAVSVVIVAHNEYLNLKRFLPTILNQNYPNFEVVLVNHSSTDDTSFLVKELQQEYPHLKYVDIKQDINFFQGKVIYAFRIGKITVL